MKTYTHFTLEERNYLAEKIAEGKSLRQIAKEMGRNVSSISRELKRNYSKKKKRYNAWRATILYILRRRKSRRTFKISNDKKLYNYILECLNKYWSPEIIAKKCNQKGLNISTKAIYDAIKRGVFPKVTPQSHLRRRGKRRPPKIINNSFNESKTSIHQRPEIIHLKSRLYDFEGDTVLGAIGKGLLITMVDRKSKFLIARKSLKKDALMVKKSIITAFKLANCPVCSITLDNGSEFSRFLEIEEELNTKVYFCDPHSPWQRGLNENTNDILRFFFPKGTNFLEVSEEEIDSVVNLINNRPRKCLDFLSPIEFLSKKCCT